MDELFDELPGAAVEEAQHGDFVDGLVVLHIRQVVASLDAVDLVFVVVEGLFALFLFIKHYEDAKEGVGWQFGQLEDDFLEELPDLCPVGDREVSEEDPLFAGAIVVLEHIDQLFLSLHVDEDALQLPLLAEGLHLQQLDEVIQKVLLFLYDGYQLLSIAAAVQVYAEIERRSEL